MADMDGKTPRQLLHDLNSLLQVIHGNLELLDMPGPADEEETRQCVSAALGSVQQAALVVRELQARARAAVG
ncbi:MAG: hypothetical protein RL026_1903 [Pseudomonadota bacterium]|jgi:signal transduction histidine kinase